MILQKRRLFYVILVLQNLLQQFEEQISRKEKLQNRFGIALRQLL